MRFIALLHSEIFRLAVLLLIWLILMLGLANSEPEVIIYPPYGDWGTPVVVTLTPTPSAVPGWWDSLPTPIPLKATVTPSPTP